MNERFIHFKDEKGVLKASVVYTRIDKTNICYAVAIVSPSELPHKVTRQIACSKTRARLSTVTGDGKHPSPGGIATWKPHLTNSNGDGLKHSHGRGSAYDIIRRVGLDKIGCLPESHFRELTQTVWQAIKQLG